MKNALYILFFCIPVGLFAQTEQDLFVGDVTEYPQNMVKYEMDENGDTMPHITHYLRYRG
jgi:hypothetical protein